MSLLTALSPFVPPHPARRPGRSCELCGAPLDPDHPHLADMECRALACACRGCALLFTRSGAAAGRWRTVPERHLSDPAFVVADHEWEALGIPVGMAFFFRSSAVSRDAASGPGEWTAVYPSPAGPVESLLRLDTWAAIAARTPLSGVLEPDVEAMLVTSNEGAGRDCMLVPIHACYALVGRVRRQWRGLDGGEEARRAIAEHLGALRERCSVVEVGSA